MIFIVHRIDYGTGPTGAQRYLHGWAISDIAYCDLKKLGLQTKGPMIQVIPIRDTQNNINAIHATAEAEGIPAAELLRKITRAYTKKAGYAVDDLEIKAGKKKAAKAQKGKAKS